MLENPKAAPISKEIEKSHCIGTMRFAWASTLENNQLLMVENLALVQCTTHVRVENIFGPKNDQNTKTKQFPTKKGMLP